jgi:hypothetical protein
MISTLAMEWCLVSSSSSFVESIRIAAEKCVFTKQNRLHFFGASLWDGLKRRIWVFWYTPCTLEVCIIVLEKSKAIIVIDSGSHSDTIREPYHRGLLRILDRNGGLDYQGSKLLVVVLPLVCRRAHFVHSSSSIILLIARTSVAYFDPSIVDQTGRFLVDCKIADGSKSAHAAGSLVSIRIFSCLLRCSVY